MSKFLHPIFKRIKTVGADPEHRAFLESIENQLHDLEGDVALMVSEMQIKRATGGWLDAWGDWYAVPREADMDDDTYREHILQEVTKPKNTIPGIVEEIERHLPEGSTVHVHEPYVDMFRFNISELSGAHRIQDDAYTRHAVIDIVIDGPLPPYLADIVHDVKAAGIRVYFTRDVPIWGEDGDGNLTHVRMYSLVEPRAAYHVHTQLKVEPLDLLRFNENSFNDAGALMSGRQLVMSNILSTRELYTDARRKITTSRNTSVGSIIDETMDQEWLNDYFDAVKNVITTRIMVSDPFDTSIDVGTVSDTTSKLINAQTKFVMGDSAIPINQYYDVPVGTLYDHGERGEAELYAGTPVMDGLVLWYDFSLKDNYSPGRERVTDLSGNGNHGTLQNFNFTEESGYNENKLLFDGVDDYIGSPVARLIDLDTYQDTLSFVVRVKEHKRNNLLYAQENLKVDIWGGSVRRADTSPSVTAHASLLDETVCVHMVKTNDRHLTYIDGEIVDDIEIVSSSTTQLSSIGYYVPDGRPNIELYDVKVYNRPLTPEEIAHNYEIEKERFGIE